MIKKLIATPKGIPASINPINKGIDEQEQKGVTAPKTDASRCANSFGCFSIYFLNLLLSM